MKPIKQILYSSHFERQLKNLTIEEKKLFIKLENRFRNNCFDPKLKTHKLTGKLEGFWAFYITYKLRLLFKFEDNGKVIFIDIGNHDIYK